MHRQTTTKLFLLTLLAIKIADSGKTIEILGGGLQANANGEGIRDDDIIRALSPNKSASDNNFTFVELIDSLAHRRLVNDYGITDGRGDGSNPFYDVHGKSIDLEAKKLFQLVPPFDPSLGPVSAKCRSQAETYRKELDKFTLWALKMYDATAKLPSGLLNGNVNQLGDFDECLDVVGKNGINGRYCLAYLQLDVDDTRADLRQLHRLLHSHYAFRSNMSDPGHRVPRFGTINWALCVPSGCGARDVEIALGRAMALHSDKTGMRFKVRVEADMCQVKRTSEDIPREAVVVGLVFAVIAALTIITGLLDHYDVTMNPVLSSLSLKRNVTKLVSLERPNGDIATIHGIRALNAFMLVLAHKSLAIFFNPYVNRTDMTEYIGRPWTVIGRAASLYTDPFIMLSGLLTSYSFIGKLDRNGKLDVKSEYINRLFRIVPTLGGLVLFCTYVMPYIGSGPQWNLVVAHHADICKKTWWRNFLFIHNYFGFEKMCLTHTHHVGIDTQLFFLSPLMIYAIHRRPKIGATLLITVALASTALRYYVTYFYRLNNYIFFGTSIRQLFDTANMSYILPSHRLTVYIIGIIAGYALRRWPKNYKINGKIINVGWFVCTSLTIGAFIGPARMGSIDYAYEPVHAAIYNAFAPIGWCALYVWITLLAHTGNTDGWLSKLLSWRGFLVSTRLSYAVYLTQFPVFFYNVGETRSAEHIGFLRTMFNLKEFVWIILTAAILTLMFEMPFQNLRDHYIKGRRCQQQRTVSTENSIERKKID